MTAAKPFRFTGWHFLACMVAFFGADIAINTNFILRSVQTFPGEVADDPYEAGIAYDRTLVREAAEQKLGWQAKVGAVAPAPGGEMLEARWADRSGAPLKGLAVTALLRRPATELENKTIRFTETAPGVYRALAPVAAGAWDADVTAVNAQGAQRTAERRLLWR